MTWKAILAGIKVVGKPIIRVLVELAESQFGAKTGDVKMSVVEQMLQSLIEAQGRAGKVQGLPQPGELRMEIEPHVSEMKADLERMGAANPATGLSIQIPAGYEVVIRRKET